MSNCGWLIRSINEQAAIQVLLKLVWHSYHSKVSKLKVANKLNLHFLNTMINDHICPDHSSLAAKKINHSLAKRSITDSPKIQVTKTADSDSYD